MQISIHNAGMIYGYARVSTGAQDLTSQLVELKAAGCEKVFREKITGTTADRPELAKLMKAPPPAMSSSPRRLIGCRATRPTFWLSPATCSAPEPVAGAPPHSGASRARPGRRQGKRRQIRSQADPHPAPAERGPPAHRSGRAAQRGA
jgi:hypothetical protein